jgi:biotin-dependent carboxylase-like uncharacterized protein
VPAGGAADPASLRLANRLAGNPGGAAGIELTLGRARLRFLAGALVAVAGAPVPLTVGPGSGGPGSPADFGAPLPVRAGSVLHIGAPPTGLRSYLAVGGGIDAPAVLGSRSADLLSGVGPPPLRAGDLLAVAAGAPARSGHPPLPAPALPPADGPALLHLVAGPRDDWFNPAALRTLGAASYTVTAASNRTGLRLDGPVLPRSGAAELPPEGIATGSLQVPPDGLPILLLADHPVTGGYPVIAVVRSADIGLAAQLRPGQRVRFAVSR